MSDTVGTQIVGFLTHMLICDGVVLFVFCDDVQFYTRLIKVFFQVAFSLSNDRFHYIVQCAFVLVVYIDRQFKRLFYP